MKPTILITLKFLKENWFKIILLLLLLQVVLDFHRLVRFGLDVDVDQGWGGWDVNVR